MPTKLCCGAAATREATDVEPAAADLRGHGRGRVFAPAPPERRGAVHGSDHLVDRDRLGARGFGVLPGRRDDPVLGAVHLDGERQRLAHADLLPRRRHQARPVRVGARQRGAVRVHGAVAGSRRRPRRREHPRQRAEPRQRRCHHRLAGAGRGPRPRRAARRPRAPGEPEHGDDRGRRHRPGARGRARPVHPAPHGGHRPRAAREPRLRARRRPVRPRPRRLERRVCIRVR